MINAILTMSLTGSAVMLTWLVAGRLFQKRLSAIWHDRFLRVALFFMLVPLGPLWEYVQSSFWIFVSGNAVDIPPVMQTTPVITPSPVIGMLAPTIPTVTPEFPAAPAVPHTVSVSPGLFQILTVIWLLGAAAMLVYKLWCYVRFRRLLNGVRTPLSDHQYEVFQRCCRELRINGSISVDISPDLPSPLATGLVWPTILLPDDNLSDTQLRCVFLHELTHIKRRDLWIRLFSLCGVVIHWYNPLMHLLNQKLKEYSEQSCDEQVAAAMSREERLTYGDMLLRLAARSSFGPSEWAVTLSTKESIQQRLSRIIKAGHWTRTDKAVALVTAVGLMLCGIVAACSAQEPLSVTQDEPPAQQEPEPLPPASEDALAFVQDEPSISPEQPESPVETVPDLPEVVPNAVPAPLPSAEAPPVEDAPTQPPPEIQPTSKTITIGGVTYETYVDNLGTVRLKNSVGNPDELYITELLSLDTLVDGKYPVNRRGETYGLASLSDYVGASPELIAVTTRDAAQNTLSGYLWWEDYYADFSDPDVAAKYEPFYSDASWLNVPYSEPIFGWYIPLYDSEHNQIGVYGAGQETLHAQSGQIRSLEDAARETDPAPVTNTIQTDEMEEAVTLTGGAIIVDGIAYPRPANNHGRDIIYEHLGDISRMEQHLLDSLPNGTYPKNSKGEYYGSDEFSNYLNIEPDLILATGTDGQEGYVWWEDAALRFECLDDLDKVIWNEDGYLIPLYDCEHNQIGWKQECTPFYNVNGDSIQITKETVDFLKALLS